MWNKYILQFETNIFCHLEQIRFAVWEKYWAHKYICEKKTNSFCNLRLIHFCNSRQIHVCKLRQMHLCYLRQMLSFNLRRIHLVWSGEITIGFHTRWIVRKLPNMKNGSYLVSMSEWVRGLHQFKRCWHIWKYFPNPIILIWQEVFATMGQGPATFMTQMWQSKERRWN